jgi:hypothetical protein
MNTNYFHKAKVVKMQTPTVAAKPGIIESKIISENRV